jgi:hypothetical protein
MQQRIIATAGCLLPTAYCQLPTAYFFFLFSPKTMALFLLKVDLFSRFHEKD